MDNVLEPRLYHDNGWSLPSLDRTLCLTERRKNIKRAMEWITQELNNMRRRDADLSYQLMLTRITVNELKITRLTSIITQNVYQKLDMENYYDRVIESSMVRTTTLPSSIPNDISDFIYKRRRHASFTNDINDRYEYEDEKEISNEKEESIFVDDFSFDEAAF